MSITFPSTNILTVTLPVIEGEFIEDTISFSPINTDYTSIWLFQKVLRTDQESLLIFSPAAEEKISKRKEAVIGGINKVIVTGNGGKVLGNFGSSPIYVLPKKDTP